MSFGYMTGGDAVRKLKELHEAHLKIAGAKDGSTSQEMALIAGLYAGFLSEGFKNDDESVKQTIDIGRSIYKALIQSGQAVSRQTDGKGHYIDEKDEITSIDESVSEKLGEDHM